MKLKDLLSDLQKADTSRVLRKPKPSGPECFGMFGSRGLSEYCVGCAKRRICSMPLILGMSV